MDEFWQPNFASSLHAFRPLKGHPPRRPLAFFSEFPPVYMFYTYLGNKGLIILLVHQSQNGRKHVYSIAAKELVLLELFPLFCFDRRALSRLY